MKKSFAIIGLGRLGSSILKNLSTLTTNIIAIDSDESRIALVSKWTEKCFVADATNKRVLKDLGIGSIDHVFITIGGNLSATILALINCKELKVKKITVRVDEEEKIDIMKRLGANEVIDPESAIGEMFAKQALSDTVLDYYPIDDDFAIVQVLVPATFKQISLHDLDSRNKYGVNIVGILRGGKFFIPTGNDLVEGNDILMVVGTQKVLRKFDQIINKK
ncbi:MAG: TrkA family potassium uptake protein [Bacilli bacterium]|nr:TrkA family potassium uptake protein [Bacilli bacterium]